MSNALLEKGDEYICGVCGGKFITDWDDKEAVKEVKENFGIIENTDVVCDDCYKKFMRELTN